MCVAKMPTTRRGAGGERAGKPRAQAVAGLWSYAPLPLELPCAVLCGAPVAVAEA